MFSTYQKLINYITVVILFMVNCEAIAEEVYCEPDDGMCFVWGGAYAICENRTCHCTPGTIKKRQNIDCFKELNVIGGSCNDPLDCSSIKNTECEDDVCVCSQGFVPNSENTCLPVASKFGDSCEDNIQCNDKLGTNVRCKDGRCSCKLGFHLVDEECFQSKELQDNCTDTRECMLIQNATCQNICICNETFIQAENRCLQVAVTIGDLCEENIQCSHTLGNSECSKGQCVCAQGFQQVQEKCIIPKDRPTRENCTSSYECNEQNENLQCINGKCTTLKENQEKNLGRSYNIQESSSSEVDWSITGSSNVA